MHLNFNKDYEVNHAYFVIIFWEFSKLEIANSLSHMISFCSNKFRDGLTCIA
jgi:hypothetical protein